LSHGNTGTCRASLRALDDFPPDVLGTARCCCWPFWGSWSVGPDHIPNPSKSIIRTSFLARAKARPFDRFKPPDFPDWLCGFAVLARRTRVPRNRFCEIAL